MPQKPGQKGRTNNRSTRRTPSPQPRRRQQPQPFFPFPFFGS
ncbi:hypothetical protein [Gordonia aquimaris]|jgi:hypothetical protein|uniref:Uncharacterized protein n=1 Tax=Gordonia aquimaris TaxID=2984863 RepID=A0A9X3D0X6_9ACTN|nr:hypothetical protein [Gordonia aquimaris]MCX2962732.1 hypothetical protein [Gordonia aquimaris]